MKLLPLSGPNAWLPRPLLRAWVQFGAGTEQASAELDRVNARLAAWLNTVTAFRSALPHKPLVTDSFPRLLVNLTLLLQTVLYRDVSYGIAIESDQASTFELLVEYFEPSLAEACLAFACTMILAALRDHSLQFESEYRRLQELADTICLGPSTAAIVEAAKSRGIPAVRLSSDNLVQLGYGSKQQRIWTAETQRTSAVGEAIAQDKELTRRLLQASGVPVPRGRKVDSAVDAWKAAQDLGGTAVVKPVDANHARGVSVGVSGQSAVERAYEIARKEGSGVLVEQFITGRHYRVLVVGDRAVAASEGEPEQVVGDGVSTVAQLVNLCNTDPARGMAAILPRSPLVLDAVALEVLARQGLTPESIPKSGQVVLCRFDGDLVKDVTGLLHPDVARDCVLAMQTVGLDIAGIDLMAERIDLPLETSGGVVLEVNSGPGLLMHLRPLIGSSQPVGEAIVEHMFGPDPAPRVPVVAALGENADVTLSILAKLLQTHSRLTAGCATRRGLVVGEQVLVRGDATSSAMARRLAINPFVDVLLLELGPQAGLEEGLGFAYWDVLIAPDAASAARSAQWQRLCPTLATLGSPRAALIQDSRNAVESDAKWNAQSVICQSAERGAANGVRATRTLEWHASAVHLLEGKDVQFVIDQREVNRLLGGSDKHDRQAELTALAAAWQLGCDLGQGLAHAKAG
ncbi:MAG TPA: hypothetical protein VHM70_04680 [Polyangiaceae bacterium]|nr:hypothetical protein [Polyangiaceae bacterium]